MEFAKLAGQWTYVSPITGRWAPRSSNVFHAGRDRNRYGNPTRWHSGNDGETLEGAPVVAVIGGKVIYSSISKPGFRNSGYGANVVILGDDGIIYRYATHRDVVLHRGDSVEQGGLVGHAGRIGRAGPHLHFEIVRPGSRAYREMVDPKYNGRFIDTHTRVGEKVGQTLDPLPFFGLKMGEQVTAGRQFGDPNQQQIVYEGELTPVKLENYNQNFEQPTEKDVERLTNVMVAEARGGGRDAMLRVGQTAMNRLDDPEHRFGYSLDGILNASDQYAKNIDLSKLKPEEQPLVAEARELAKGLIDRSIPPVTDAFYFATPEAAAKGDFKRNVANRYPSAGADALHVFYGKLDREAVAAQRQLNPAIADDAFGSFMWALSSQPDTALDMARAAKINPKVLTEAAWASTEPPAAPAVAAVQAVGRGEPIPEKTRGATEFQQKYGGIKWNELHSDEQRAITEHFGSDAEKVYEEARNEVNVPTQPAMGFDRGKVMWGLSGQSWPGKEKVAQNDASMAEIAAKMGYNYRKINVSGDHKADQLAELKRQWRPGDSFIGQSAGAFVGAKFLKSLPPGSVKDAVLMGGPVKVDGAIVIPAVRGVEHVDTPEFIAAHIDQVLPRLRPEHVLIAENKATPKAEEIPAESAGRVVAAETAPLAGKVVSVTSPDGSTRAVRVVEDVAPKPEITLVGAKQLKAEGSYGQRGPDVRVSVSVPSRPSIVPASVDKRPLGSVEGDLVPRTWARDYPALARAEVLPTGTFGEEEVVRALREGDFKGAKKAFDGLKSKATEAVTTIFSPKPWMKPYTGDFTGKSVEKEVNRYFHNVQTAAPNSMIMVKDAFARNPAEYQKLDERGKGMLADMQRSTLPLVTLPVSRPSIVPSLGGTKTETPVREVVATPSYPPSVPPPDRIFTPSRFQKTEPVKVSEPAPAPKAATPTDDRPYGPYSYMFSGDKLGAALDKPKDENPAEVQPVAFTPPPQLEIQKPPLTVRGEPQVEVAPPVPPPRGPFDRGYGEKVPSSGQPPTTGSMFGGGSSPLVGASGGGRLETTPEGHSIAVHNDSDGGVTTSYYSSTGQIITIHTDTNGDTNTVHVG